MPPKKTSPWVFVLGILFVLLVIVIVLVLRASKKIAPTVDSNLSQTDASDFTKKPTDATTQYTNSTPTTPTTTTSPTIAGQAGVSSLDLLVLESFPVQVNAVVKGDLSDPCVSLGAPVVTYTASTKKFSIFMPTSRPTSPTTACADVLVPYTKSIPLNVTGLSAGVYTVSVGTQTKTFILDTDNVVQSDGGK